MNEVELAAFTDAMERRWLAGDGCPTVYVIGSSVDLSDREALMVNTELFRRDVDARVIPGCPDSMISDGVFDLWPPPDVA